MGTIITVELESVSAVIFANKGGHTGSYSPAKINVGILLFTASKYSFGGISGRYTLLIALSRPGVIKDARSGNDFMM